MSKAIFHIHSSHVQSIIHPPTGLCIKPIITLLPQNKIKSFTSWTLNTPAVSTLGQYLMPYLWSAYLNHFIYILGHLTVEKVTLVSHKWICQGWAYQKELHPIINEHVVSGSLDMFYKEKLTGKRMKESYRESSWLHIFDRFGL